MLNFIRTDEVELEQSRPSDNLDKVGATASFLCAIHCAIMPFVLTMLPLVGLSFLASEPVEWALLAFSAILGTLSLCVGFREHRSRRVFAFLGIALALLVAGRIFHESYEGWWGPVFMVAGGFTMMGAHWLNHSLCRSCRKCSAHGCCN